MKKSLPSFIASAILLLTTVAAGSADASGLDNPRYEYFKLLRQTARGWNTWDTRSVLTQVLLPESFAIKMEIRDGNSAQTGNLRIGDTGPDSAVLQPSDHSLDGEYTDITVSWHGIRLRIQSASKDEELVILATPLEGKAQLVIRPELCWQIGTRYSDVWCEKDCFRFTAQNSEKSFRFFVSANTQQDSGALVCNLDSPITISSLGKMTAQQAQDYIRNVENEEFGEEKLKYGSGYETFRAMRNILAWDTIFDPSEQKIFTTVSRKWNMERAAVPELGGYALFEWDNYFAAMMLSLENRELAYLNAIENSFSIDECGFVPNVRSDHGLRSYDRSEPPIGALAVWTLYSRFREKWLLELLFDRLLEWNRWWDRTRKRNGLLCYGSNGYPHIICRENEYRCGNRAAAILESGMDNSQMYDDASFDTETELLNIQDVGLTSLYIEDCRCLERMAKVLERRKEEKELKKRADFYSRNAHRFWCEEDGMYYNIDAQSGEFVKRCSPTSFYPLLAGIADPRQASELIDRHLTNPDEFWGEWIIPATPRNDPAFTDNSYWRGRIWAPLNCLVYLGLRNYSCADAVRAELAEKSECLLMKSWKENACIYENYSAVDGRGDDVGNSDRFYHWGALLGYIAILQRNVEK